MNEQGDFIDLRDGQAINGGVDGNQLADDYIEVLANALSEAPGPMHQDERGFPPTPVVPGPASAGHAPVREPHHHETAVPLKRIDSLPRLLRRRIQVDLGEGESVECVVLAVRGTVPRWGLATTHRVVIDDHEDTPGGGAMSLPYHRTTASVGEDGSIQLLSREFDRVRNASLQPDAAYSAETVHLLARVATG